MEDLISGIAKQEYYRQWAIRNKEERKEYRRQWYQDNKDRLTKKHKRYRKDTKYNLNTGIGRTRYWIRGLVNHGRCFDCGLADPDTMEFDHVPERGKKLFNIGSGYRYSVKNITEELLKCDLVCANCHRKRTKLRLRTMRT